MQKLKALLYSLSIFAIVTYGATTWQSAFARTSPSSTNTFVSFSTFIRSVVNARYQDYVSENGAAVNNVQAFAEMRSYVLTMYSGVQQVSSYVMDGQYFDCITVNSQPSVRYLKIHSIAKPPTALQATTRERSAQNNRSPLTLGQKDAFGNPIACRAGTIPMERITLQRLSKFHTLQDFLAKQPGGRSSVQAAQPGAEHRYAHAYQFVTNYGGNSWLNLWNPSGDFSISQQWYVGGSGDNRQTVEGGWIHYPDKFGSQSVLFIFYTPDNYKDGCYDLDCPAFVQINNNWALGGAWDHYSSYGGTQYGFALQWKYYQGNWWLFVQNQAVGYYPGAVYNGGQMATNAELIDYGGETYTSGTDWPQMGSGKFASEGWQQAAFQNTIFYIPRDENGGTGVSASLNTIETNPSCYTIALTPSENGGNWGTYFFFGGPGGQC